MTALFPDTDPKAEAVLIDLLSKAPSWRMMEMVDQLNQAVTLLLLAGIRDRYPEEDEALHRRLLADLI